MASAFDSPDTVQLKGKPTGITRLSRKAKLGMSMLGFLVLAFILFSVVSMDDEEAPAVIADKSTPEGKAAEAEKPKVQAARPDFEDVGDGQAAVAVQAKVEPSQASPATLGTNGGAAAATAPASTQGGQNIGPAYNLGAAIGGGTVPKLSPAALGGSPQQGSPPAGASPGGNAAQQQVNLGRPATQADGQQYQSPEERESQRIKKDMMDRKEAAVKAPLDAQWGDGLASAVLGEGRGAGTNPGAVAAAQLKAMLAGASGQGGGGAPSGSIPALGMLGGLGQQQDDPNKQGRKEQFLRNSEGQMRTTLKDSVLPAISPFKVEAGWAIPSSLQCGINSDVPGQTCARVMENVYDSATGRHLLIPQNSRLIGTYDSQIAYGQARILVAWTRLFFPDGSSIALEGMPGADRAGNAGFDANVNNHYAKVFGSAALMATFSAAVSLTQKQSAGTAGSGGLTNSQSITQSLGQQLGQTGAAFIQRGMNVQPTLTRDPGYKFNVMVTRDIIFPSAYEGGYSRNN